MLSKIFGNLDYRHWILTHLVWIVAVAVGLLAGRIALQEHDARVLADATVKADQANIVTLQQHIAATDAAAAQKVQTVVKIVHDVTTPAQAIPAIPQLTDVPLNSRPSVDNPAQVSVDAVPLVQLLGQCKEDSVNLTKCQSDLTDQKAIDAKKDDEIKALKKKPSFTHRLKKDLEFAGICIGIGAALVGLHL